MVRIPARILALPLTVSLVLAGIAPAIAFDPAPPGANPGPGDALAVPPSGVSQTLGTLVGALPGLSASVAGVGVPGLDNPPGWFVFQHPDAFTTQPAIRAQRAVPDSGGTAGHTYKAVWGLTGTGRNAVGYEWAITGEVRNRTLATTGAQHVAVNGTIFKEAIPGAEAAKSWGGNFVCDDLSGTAQPRASCIGAEINTFTNATGPDPYRQRVGLQIAAGSRAPSAGADFAYGILMGSNRGVDRIDRGIALRQAYAVGLDTTGGTFSVAPVVLGAGQRLVLDGNDHGAYHRSLRYQDGSLIYESQNGPVLRIDDRGGLTIPGPLVLAGGNAPASATAPCTAGQQAWDARYEYRCVATNLWRRAALSAW